MQVAVLRSAHRADYGSWGKRRTHDLSEEQPLIMCDNALRNRVKRSANLNTQSPAKMRARYGTELVLMLSKDRQNAHQKRTSAAENRGAPSWDE